MEFLKHPLLTYVDAMCFWHCNTPEYKSVLRYKTTPIMLFQDLFNLCVNTLNPLQSRFIFVNYNSLHQINFPENLRISNF